MTDSSGFNLGDLDGLAQRSVESVMRLIRRANALAGGALIVTVVLCLVGFFLGVAALDNGMRTVWIVVGGILAIVGIGAVVLAMFRLSRVRRGSDELVREVRALIGRDEKSQRTVIETVESADGSTEVSVVGVSRQFFSLRDIVGDRAGQFATLGRALTAITSFPLLMVLATVIAFAFAVLSLLFAIGLLL